MGEFNLAARQFALKRLKINVLVYNAGINLKGDKQHFMVMETLITGVTGTNGSATVLEIARSGATVSLLARNSNKKSNPARIVSLTVPSTTNSSAYLWQWSFLN